jgi:type I restriction enzyme S subunit
MIAHQLPPGWDWKRLGEICEEDKVIVDGRSSDLPFLGLEMVEAETGKINWDAQTVEGTSTCFYFDERHILYGKLRPYLNKVALPDVQGRCSTELIPLFPRMKIVESLLRTCYGATKRWIMLWRKKQDLVCQGQMSGIC